MTKDKGTTIYMGRMYPQDPVKRIYDVDGEKERSGMQKCQESAIGEWLHQTDYWRCLLYTSRCV